MPMPDPKRYKDFADLIELSTSQVLSYLHALLLNWNDAEDVFQETCLVLWQKFDEFRPGTNFVAWALRIAQHKVMDFQKQQKRRTAFTAGLRDTLMTEIADQSSEVEAAFLAALAGCMDRLTPGDHRMVKLSYVEGVPVRQIADAMGRSPESVHNSLHRIRSWLLACVQRESRQAGNPAPIHRSIVEEEDGP
jgi:RNA polymerase sigma-70 factor, ECF subfamily